MSVLFILPRWEDVSTGWMHRMMASLSDHISVIALSDAKGNVLWNETIPVKSLYPTATEVRYFSRAYDYLGLSLRKGHRKAEHILEHLIRRMKIQKIFCQYGTYAERFMNLWRNVDLPLYVHFHGYDATFDLRCVDQPDKKFFSSQYLENMKELSERSIFMGCKFTKGLLTDAGISPDRVRVKIYGVTVPETRHIHYKKDEIQILHLGRAVDFKSPDRTIHAFEIAKSRGLKGNLVMIGDGPLRVYCELLRLRSRYKDSIRISGNVSNREAYKLYSESDIFTAHNITGEITRQTENFGVSIVEAMASGLPIVGTRNGGVNDTVVDGLTGFLNMPGDVEAQADSLLRLAQNPDLRQQIGDAGRDRVTKEYSTQMETLQLKSILGL